MLLYIHVPFCRSKCRYCAFHSEALLPPPELPAPRREALAAMEPARNTNLDMAQAMGEEAAATLALAQSQLPPQDFFLPPERPAPPPDSGRAIQDWLDTLLLEMADYGDKLGRPPVRTVFFGGGTPSLLPPDIMNTIMNRARRCFRIDSKAEISMEANPESINPKHVKGWLRAGVNRISLGVQSLDDAMLEFMGRPHSAADAIRAYNTLRTSGCRNVGLDLIWGLPGQKVSAWLAQLGEVIRLRPDHLSCYGLTVEPGTPLERMVEDGTAVLPGEREQTAMYMRGAEILEEAGFLHYEVSNFARMGYQCRHNMGYWDGMDYLGLGPAATSTIGSKRWTNPRDRKEWKQTVLGIRQPERELLSELDKNLEYVMLRLRTTLGLQVKAYHRLTGRNFLKDHKQLIHALHQNGLLRIQHGYVRLTRNGLLVSNSILSHFFDSLKRIHDASGN